MKVTTTWQKCFDMESEIEYLGSVGEVGEYYFKITRRESEAFWDPEDETIFAIVEDGRVVDYEGYSTHPTKEEEELIERILIEKNIL